MTSHRFYCCVLLRSSRGVNGETFTASDLCLRVCERDLHENTVGKKRVPVMMGGSVFFQMTNSIRVVTPALMEWVCPLLSGYHCTI